MDEVHVLLKNILLLRVVGMTVKCMKCQNQDRSKT